MQSRVGLTTHSCWSGHCLSKGCLCQWEAWMHITKVSVLLTLGLWPVMCIFLPKYASLRPAWTLHTHLAFVGGLNLQWVARRKQT